ncbi:MAG: class I SAM-dependent methyltransferase [Promethearchaeota archaeon]
MNYKNNSKWKVSWSNRKSDLVKNYDFLHNITIPKRAETLSLFQQYAKFIPEKEKIFIDLGTGTGAVAFSILERYNDAKAILIDGSKPMLEKAQEIANRKRYNIDKIIYQDLNEKDWINKCNLKSLYPLIVSSLTIHHLINKEKARLFKDIYKLLFPSGRFIYMDVIEMETKEEEKFHFDLWVEEIIRNKIKYGVNLKTFEEEREWLINAQAAQGDIPAKISFILDSLKKAGFKKYGIVWFYVKFSMFIGIK